MFLRILFIGLLCIYSNLIKSENSYLDSLETKFKENSSEDLSKIALEIALYHYQITDDTENAELWIDKALEKAIKTESESLFKIIYWKTQILTETNQFERALSVANRLDSLAKLKNDTNTRLKARFLIG
ncbi:MAG: hypothetical protein MRY83_11815, partial [Flavobacteriales bacterium]|nr:hypothetical protein [Flavobacteriales bacterium]